MYKLCHRLGNVDGNAATTMSTSGDVDSQSVARALGVEPQWSGVASAAQAVGLAQRTLLHAGPPVSGAPSRPILNSACLAAVLEGWAKDVDEAEALIRAGKIMLMPAQDRSTVTPLAGVV